MSNISLTKTIQTKKYDYIKKETTGIDEFCK